MPDLDGKRPQLWNKKLISFALLLYRQTTQDAKSVGFLNTAGNDLSKFITLDSLSQIVLGAAVGEIMLGKKLGNRAMFWGAVANTVPDLDILGNLWMSQLDSLVFHRGISHSITFALIFPCLMAWLVKRYYEKEKHRSSLRRIITSSLGSLCVILVSVLFIFIAKTLGASTITFTLTTANSRADGDFWIAGRQSFW